ncbi:hypothetical protein KXS07_22785 [Inquilinus limosus]|uniref:hypothetical protein n=1 Tax=Inquilinus limosus TaxID=171674 RepID=UPI0004039B9F|nr:hypothetical protein [Inquilinus limosus]
MLIAAAAAMPARAGDVPLVTGEHWTKASDSEKKAFLVGAANVISVEYELRKEDRRHRPGMVDALVTKLQPMSLSDISKGIDDYYTAHPDQLSRAVVEVIVTDIARIEPGRQAGK